MDYRWRSGLVVAILIGMVALSGVIIGKGGSNIIFSGSPAGESPPGMTGAATGEIDCQGSDCPELCQDYSCVIACYDDQDCDDRMAATEDTCKNPGTEFSLCVNQRKN